MRWQQGMKYLLSFKNFSIVTGVFLQEEPNLSGILFVPNWNWWKCRSESATCKLWLFYRYTAQRTASGRQRISIIEPRHVKSVSLGGHLKDSGLQLPLCRIIFYTASWLTCICTTMCTLNITMRVKCQMVALNTISVVCSSHSLLILSVKAFHVSFRLF